MLRTLMFFALAIVSIIAIAADGQPVKAPYIERGDCWSYHVQNLDHLGRIDDFEFCVTFVDREKDVMLGLFTVKGTGRELNAAFTLEWNPHVSITGTISSPATKYFKFPLHVGDRYSSTQEWRRPLEGPNEGRTRWTMEVVGWEQITVPAGAFRALRIEGSGAVERYDTRSTFPVTITFWYVPEVNSYVKFLYVSPSGPYGQELTGYRLTK